ncbi:MAG: SPOR domain-containing protein [Ramlibacter sp.]
MAFFKFRKGGAEAPAATAQPESVEALRRRARHRLIGAAVLVLVGVTGFPLLFDTQPRPIAVDIPIEIPDRAKARPLPAPPQPQPQPQPHAQGTVADQGAPQPAAAKAAAAPSAAASTAAAAPAKEVARSEPVQPAPAAPAHTEPARPASTQARAEAARPEPARAADSPRAQALLEGKQAAAQAEGCFIVQVGAFADVGKAREARLKVEKAGLKTYTQVAETKEGRRIRVRVGPFANRTEADKAASRIKGLDLQASILTL